MNNNIIKIKELFNKIRLRSGMYICNMNYELFCTFILGFETAEEIYFGESILHNFRRWIIKNKFQNRSGFSWEMYIWNDSFENDEVAIETLFNYLNEYFDTIIDKNTIEKDNL